TTGPSGRRPTAPSTGSRAWSSGPTPSGVGHRGPHLPDQLVGDLGQTVVVPGVPGHGGEDGGLLALEGGGAAGDHVAATELLHVVLLRRSSRDGLPDVPSAGL